MNTWTLGDAELGDLVGSQGLEIGGVHEIKPAIVSNTDTSLSADGTPTWAASWSAARAFLLRMLVRRLQTCPHEAVEQSSVLWCWPQTFARELGELYAPGLAALGIAPVNIVTVEPSRAQDVLWAMEEGLKSAGVACVVGILDDVDLTPARRLALAAQKSEVPALILTGPRTPSMAATATCWRVAPALSGAHPIDRALPGPLRLNLSLERCRNRPLAGSTTMTTMEWCDETFRFRMAADVCNRTRKVSAVREILESSRSEAILRYAP